MTKDNFKVEHFYFEPSASINVKVVVVVVSQIFEVALDHLLAVNVDGVRAAAGPFRHEKGGD